MQLITEIKTLLRNEAFLILLIKLAVPRSSPGSPWVFLQTAGNEATGYTAGVKYVIVQSVVPRSPPICSLNRFHTSFAFDLPKILRTVGNAGSQRVKQKID